MGEKLEIRNKKKITKKNEGEAGIVREKLGARKYREVLRKRYKKKRKVWIKNKKLGERQER